MIDRINSFFLVSVLTLEIVVIWNLELWGLQLHDRFSFWAASRSFLDHQNPYLLDQVMEHVKLCCQALPPENTPIERIWGIPIIFALISWFGLFSFDGFLLAHLMFTCLALGVSFFLLRKLFIDVFGRLTSIVLEGLALVSFFPFIVTPIVGPAVPYSLLGISIFLSRRTRLADCTKDFWGGYWLSLFLIKPHVISLLAAGIFFLSIARRSFQTFIGIVAGFCSLVAITLAINPALWVYYLDIFRDFPVNLYLTPTIASWVGNYFSLQGVLRFIPFLLAFVSVGVWSVRSVKQSEVISTESEITAVSRLLVFSLICAPYLWVYDFVVALPALFLALYQSKSRSQLVFTSVTLTLGHLVLFTVASPMHFSVWYPFLLASLLFKPHRNAIQPKVTSNNVFVR